MLTFCKFALLQNCHLISSNPFCPQGWTACSLAHTPPSRGMKHVSLFTFNSEFLLLLLPCGLSAKHNLLAEDRQIR